MVNNTYIHAYMMNNNIYYAHLTYVAFEHCVCHESLLTSFIFMYLDYIYINTKRKLLIYSFIFWAHVRNFSLKIGLLLRLDA